MKSAPIAAVVLALLVGACGAAPPRAASGEAASAVPAGPSGPADPRFDAVLSGFAYPYPVQTFEVRAQEQTLHMAYMDVKPGKKQQNGKTVVLLHGKNFGAFYWKRTIELLVGQGYRVVAPDQIGFGKSDKPAHFQYSFHGLASYTRALLGSLGIAKASVIGHSMGGMLAVRSALMFPEQTERLVLVNPIGLEDWRPVVPYRSVDAWYASERASTPERIREYQRKSYYGGEWKPAYEALIEPAAGQTRQPDYPRVAWASALTYEMIYTQPVVYELPNVRASTLLVIGQRDRTALGRDTVSPEVAETLGRYPELGKKAQAAIPGAKLVEIEGAGHLPQVEAWDAYARALLEFFATP